MNKDPFTQVLVTIILLVNILTNNAVISQKCPSPDLILPCRCLLKSNQYQVWCSHSELSKVRTGLQSLSQYISKPIDELILENNFLPIIPENIFHPLKILRLMIRYNSLEKVSSKWLAGLEGALMEIFIVEPKLKYLPDDSLAKLNVLEALTIKSDDLKRLPQITSLRKLRYIQIESNALAELSARNFKLLPSLEKLQISGSPNLVRLEDGLLVDLPLLKTVNISSSGISWLHPRTFTGLPNLKELALSYNKILDAGMVGRASKDLLALETLWLDFNQIPRLSEASFVDIPSLKVLHLSDNNIIEVHRGAFHRVPNLKKIHMNDNIIRHIHPECFMDVSESIVEELWMINNDISHVKVLRSILEAFPRLIFLDLSMNQIDVIPFGLREHKTIEIIKLNHNRLIQIDRESFIGMPNLRELGLKNNSLRNNNQEPLWNLPSLKGLDISHNFFRRLEPMFLANLPALRRLDVSHNEIMVVDQTTFSNTPLIEFVNISYNHLPYVHPSTFSHLVNLYELDLGHNQLAEFPISLPKGLEYLHLSSNRVQMVPLLPTTRSSYSLRFLDISENLIEKLSPRTLKVFPALRRLYIKNNNLQKIEEGTFENLSKLENLDLRKNKIMHIHPNAFKETHELKELHLGDNNIEAILPAMLQKLPKLSNLDISGNKLVDFVQGNLRAASTLKYLNVSNNFIVKFPMSISNIRQLQVLDLSNNRIKELPRNAFVKLGSLKKLRLSENFIYEVYAGTFESLKKLSMLYLDDNEIESIETNSVHSLPNLELIDLRRNKLQHIPNLVFNNLTKLQVVELQYNKLKSISHNAFNIVPNLLILNISHNHLNSLEDAGLNGVPSLELLDISYNKIKRIPPNGFKNMEWLVEIKMDHNHICGIFGTPFNHMPRLRVISLRHNRIITISEKVLEKIMTNLAVFNLDNNPLNCNCDLIWLQVWSQESLIVGPRCSDGSQLREIQFIPAECEKRERSYPYHNCEDNTIEQDTSQVFSKYAKWKNLTNEENNLLGPLPEETDYFYDEYVDLSPGEAPTTILNNEDNYAIIGANKSFQGFVETTSHHLIPGDTPTLYAAPKNKSKPDIPKEVLNSPSNSGFTFFGVPLPSINLNQLLGGPKSKATDAKTAQNSPIPVANRKNAIMNHPPTSTRTTKKFKPPPVSEIETGGFIPVLPGVDGFKPMVYAIPKPVPVHKNFTKPLDNQGSTSNDDFIDQIVNFKTTLNPNLASDGSLIKPPLVTTPYPNLKLEKSTTKKPDIVDKTTTIISLTSSTTEKESKQILELNFISTTPVSSIETTVKSINASNTRRIMETDSSESNFTTSTSTTTPTTTTVKTTQHNFKLPKAIPTLLAPINQQIPSRPFSRSTITKVQSPHPVDSASNKKEVIDEAKPQSVVLESKSDVLNEENNWYFANYNKTYSEPFVSGIGFSSNKNSAKTFQYQHLLLVFLLIISNKSRLLFVRQYI